MLFPGVNDTFHQDGQTTFYLVEPKKMLLGVCHTGFFEKKLAIFFPRDGSIHFEKVDSLRLRSYGNDLTIFTVIFGTPCWPLKIVSWGSSHSINRENQEQAKIFFHLEERIFLKNLVQEFLGPKTEPYSSQKICQNTL